MLVLPVMGLSIAGTAQADTTETIWDGGTTTTTAFSLSTNYSNGAPSATVSAEFDSAFTNQPTLGTTAATSQGIWVTGTGSDGVSGLVTIGGTAILTITGTATLDSVANAGILLDGTGNNSLTISAPVTVSNSTSFIVNNTGTLTLQTGALVITAGKVLTLSGVSGSNILISSSTTATTGAIIDNSAGTVTLSGTNLNTGLLTLSGGGTLNATTASIDGSSTTSGITFTTAASTLQAGTGGITTGKAVTLTYGGIFDLNGTTSALSGNITGGGTGGLTVANSSTSTAGTLTLSGSGNTFSKGLSITNAGGAGTTVIDGNASTATLGSGTVTMATGTTLDLGNNSPTVTGLSGTGTITNVTGTAATPTLTLSNAASTTYAGVISNGNATSLGLALTAGTQSLSGANTYTGGTAINGGTLEFTQTNAMPASGTIAVASGATLAIEVAGATGQFTTGTSGAGTIGGIFSGVGGQNNTVTLASGSAVGIDTGTTATTTETYAGNITNAGVGLTKLGLNSTLILSGQNTYTGTTTINAGLLQLGSAEMGTSGPVGEGTINFPTSNGTLQYSSANQYDYSSRLTGAYIKVDTNGQNVTFATALPSTNATLVVLDTGEQGSMTLTAANAYPGQLIVNGTVIAQATNSGTGGVQVNGPASTTGSGLLELDNATNGGVSTGTLNFNAGTVISLLANQTLANNVTDAAGGGFGGTNSITVNGNFTLTANNKSFSNNISGGTLTFGSAVGSGSTLNIDQVTGTAQDLILNGTGNTVINSVIEDFSGGVGTSHGILNIQNTGGTITLAGANTYQGTTSITGAGGTTLLTGSLTSSAITINNANATFTESSTGAINNGSGTTTFTLTNGTATLGGTNGYTGLTTVTAGTLTLNGSLTSAITVSSAGTLTGAGTTTGAITLNGNITPGTIGSTSTKLAAASLTFNSGGMLTYALSSTDATSNYLSLTGALTKGTTGTYNINLTGGVPTDTYVLASFASTTFTTPNATFTAVGDTGTFSFATAGSLEDLDFTVNTVTGVPEPRTTVMAAMLLLTALFSPQSRSLWKRGRRA